MGSAFSRPPPRYCGHPSEQVRPKGISVFAVSAVHIAGSRLLVSTHRLDTDLLRNGVSVFAASAVLLQALTDSNGTKLIPGIPAPRRLIASAKPSAPSSCRNQPLRAPRQGAISRTKATVINSCHTVNIVDCFVYLINLLFHYTTSFKFI